MPRPNISGIANEQPNDADPVSGALNYLWGVGPDAEVAMAAPHAYDADLATIAAGAVSISRGLVLLFGESSIDDNLDTITGPLGGFEAGTLVSFAGGSSVASGRHTQQITIRHGQGNILLATDEPFVIDRPGKAITLRWDGTNWVETARSGVTPEEATTSLPWGSVTGKPSTFPPTGHTHPWNQLTSVPSTFPPSGHNHPWSGVTGKPSTFTPSSHSHPWSQVSGKPSTFTPNNFRISGSTPQWLDGSTWRPFDSPSYVVGPEANSGVTLSDAWQTLASISITAGTDRVMAAANGHPTNNQHKSPYEVRLRIGGTVVGTYTNTQTEWVRFGVHGSRTATRGSTYVVDVQAKRRSNYSSHRHLGVYTNDMMAYG